MRLVTLPIRSLKPADSPRLRGGDTDHVMALADCGADLPPILVHRPTMRVIDGMHRLQAAELRGDEDIQAWLVEGTTDLAFLLAVEANVAHGLPLSLTDRKAAAARIIASFPQRSDRSIARSTGLADKTVAAIRRRTGMDKPASRLGRDGRVYPLDSAEGRRAAGEFMTANPGATLREVAKASGISLGTAVDVRKRLRRGDDPVLSRQRAEPEPSTSDQIPPGQDVLQALRADPSLWSTDIGRTLLRWFHFHMVEPREWGRLADGVPPHRAGDIAELALACAELWQEFARQLRRRQQAAARQRPVARSQRTR
ncbi:hypothetical protein AOZ06_38600 [Kibdelosporangium phytohabitans]|uniref:ParB-like N-terminal domain-containing protein n=2 Tax=Kibdelosporangium phytohabitans TaxID=860235 RepID=A0A0N9IFX3_9PSEU|nr:ParB/RepB/Spo0J family partition protein [Kibdelosporangium phytohabitans]ALG15386.1 hypothetical protein AOZ06_38600 [Kibdelosporangium phytohabitans]